jgi:hypothetical protein
MDRLFLAKIYRATYHYLRRVDVGMLQIDLNPFARVLRRG